MHDDVNILYRCPLGLEKEFVHSVFESQEIQKLVSLGMVSQKLCKLIKVVVIGKKTENIEINIDLHW